MLLSTLELLVSQMRAECASHDLLDCSIEFATEHEQKLAIPVDVARRVDLCSEYLDVHSISFIVPLTPDGAECMSYDSWHVSSAS